MAGELFSSAIQASILFVLSSNGILKDTIFGDGGELIIFF